MSAFNLASFTESNENYRVVISTSPHLQLVTMSITDLIPKEVHVGIDQFLNIVKGTARITVNGSAFELKAGDSILVPGGAEHEVVNSGNSPLKLFTIYSPPHHKSDTIQQTRT